MSRRKTYSTTSVDEALKVLSEAKLSHEILQNIKEEIREAKDKAKRSLKLAETREQNQVARMRELAKNKQVTFADFETLGNYRRRINISRSRLGMETKSNWDDIYPKKV